MFTPYVVVSVLLAVLLAGVAMADFVRSKLDFPHLHGGVNRVSPCQIGSSRSCRDFSHFTPGHQYGKSGTREMRWGEEAREAL